MDNVDYDSLPIEALSKSKDMLDALPEEQEDLRHLVMLYQAAKEAAEKAEESVANVPISFDWLEHFKWVDNGGRMYGLKPMQLMTVMYYICDPVGGLMKAARKAGYCERRAEQATKHKGINLAIKAAVNERMQRLRITSDRVFREFGNIAFLDPGDVIDVKGREVTVRDFSKIPKEARRAIQEIKTTVSPKGESQTTVKFYDKIAALNALGRAHGMFKDKVEITDNTGLGQAINDARRRANERVIEAESVTTYTKDFDQ